MSRSEGLRGRAAAEVDEPAIVATAGLGVLGRLFKSFFIQRLDDPRHLGDKLLSDRVIQLKNILRGGSSPLIFFPELFDFLFSLNKVQICVNLLVH